MGIVHRDIKPPDILIFVPPLSEEDADDDSSLHNPQIKLADLGISKALDAGKYDYTSTSVSNPNGTRGWIAPEVYQKKKFD